MADQFFPWISIGISSGTLLVLLWAMAVINAKLNHLSARLEHRESPYGEEEIANVSSPDSGSAFEIFLNEQSGRRDLPKSEQFAEYRKWRKEKGMNWSK